MELKDEEFYKIVNFMKKNFGIELGKKRVLVQGRMENYLARNGYDSFDGYIEKCIKNPGGKECEYMINMLTTNHTFFMREPVHFRFLEDTVLPWMKKKEENTRDVRIWSAASSSGEEAYTIAMILADYFGRESVLWDKSVLATDISRKVLAAAKEGIYSAEHLKDVPERWIRKYFDEADNCNMQVKAELRKEVVFRYFNLMDPFPFKRKFHAIFLRNVMIYFDENTKAELLRKIYNYLETGGYLFTGLTEAIDEERAGLTYVEPSVYRKDK